MKKFRMHILSLAHLPVSEEYISCAFTQKIVKFSRMMTELGHEVFVYGAEGGNPVCTEYIQTHTLSDIRKRWGEGDSRFKIGYNFEEKAGFKFDEGKPSNVILKMFKNSIKEIEKRRKEDDFLILTQGNYHKPVSDALNMFLTVENGVGYAGSIAKFRAFESNQIQNFTYGREEAKAGNKYKKQGSPYDRVIPNYFQEEDFYYQPKKQDYFLYIGRIIPAKGLEIAIQTTKAVGAKLIIAGQGKIESSEKHVEFVGYADKEKRKYLLADAKGFFYPTQYIEPFGGAAVEAMISGTPIITSNFGVFPEYNIQGVTGYRCNTFQQYVDAAKNIDLIDPSIVRQHGERFLTKNVKFEFQEWFEDLYKLYEMAKGIRKTTYFFTE